MISVAACMFLALFSAAGADFLINDDFDREATGAKPAGYLLEELGGSVSIADVPSAANKSVYLNDPGGNVIKIAKKFAPQTGLMTAETWFMQPSLGTTAKVLRLLDQEGVNAAVHIETRKEGNSNVLSYKNLDGAYTSLGPYNEMTWYVVTVVADVATQKADVYVNGVLKLNQSAFQAPVKEIAALDSYTPGSSAKGHYLDGIKVYPGRREPSKGPAQSAAPAYTAVSGSALVKDLLVYDTVRANFWSVGANVQVGAPLFGDRAYTIASMPPSLAGYENIMPSCDAKKYLSDPLATFVVGTDAEVYVAHDDRVTVKPAWLAGWTDSGLDVVDNEASPVTYSLFKKAFTAGTLVTLGNNGGSSGCTQYFVIVKGTGQPKPAPSQAPAVSIPVVWDAVLVQKPEWYAGEEAIRIADNVLLYQRDIGGWPKGIDMAAKLTDADRSTLAQLKSNPADCTIDNTATTTQLRFLAKVYNAANLERFKAAFLKGLDYLLAAQYPNGGWPQYYPNTSLYYARITFNDNAMVNVLNLLRETSGGKGDYHFVDQERREKCTRAVQKGIECILRCQVRVKGRLTAWCAQHDEKTLAPAPARAYELASLSGSESVGLVRFLMSIETPDPRVIEAVDAAVAWFEKVRLEGIKVIDKPDPSLPGGFDRVVVADPSAPPIWARFYEIGTDRPFFCGRDGVKKFSMAEIEHERRVGYAWYTNAPSYLLEKEYPLWRSRYPHK